MRRIVSGQSQNKNLRVQHDQLQAQLATRVSIGHFAHAAVSLIFAVIASGVAGKFFWNGEGYRELAIVASVGVGCLMLYSLVRYVAGRRYYRTEKSAFARLKALRLVLQADDPAAFLPR